MQEEYFPRGGTRPKTDNKEFKSDNLFTTLNKKNKKKRKSSVNEDVEGTISVTPHLTSADLLSYEKILPGMVILGCVRNISSYAIDVELPGRTFGKIGINAISDTLSNSLLEKAENSNEADIEENVLNILPKIFIQHQFLPVFALEVKEDENGSRHVVGSVIPKHINVHLRTTTFKKGMLVWGSIWEKSDYVYIIDLGVKNTRVVLPFKNCITKAFVEGETSWFVITEIRNDDNIVTLTVTLNENTYKSVKDELKIDELLPGMCVQFHVTKILKDGLEGTYFNNCLGYINQAYLEHPMDMLPKYRDADVKAYVLYIHPTTKFAYFTLRNIHQMSKAMPSLSNGFISSAKILQNLGRGVMVQLKNNEFGFVTYKRLIKSVKLQDSSDLTEVIKRKFPIGSKHSCRILDYINMDKIYVCTFEQSALKEKVFSQSDLSIGQTVKGVVEAINSSGIALKIGNLHAFVTNEHISNVAYSDNLKRNYRIGDPVIARVWNIIGNSIKLTLKQSFIEDDNCLTSYGQVKKNSEYKGMVVKTYVNGALICFYGGVKGYLKSADTQKNFKHMFYQGQVIKVIAAHIDGNNLLLTLDTPQSVNRRKLQIGQFTDGTVVSVNDKGLLIQTKTGNMKGYIPKHHLSIDTKLADILLNLYNEGDEVRDLICLREDNERIFSRREYSFYKDRKFSIPQQNQLQVGLVLRCSLHSFDSEKVLLSSPFYNDYLVLDRKEAKHMEPFTENQEIVAQITAIDGNEAKLTTELPHISFQYSIDLLRLYLNDVNNIHEKLLAKGDALAQYKAGQPIMCEIKRINNIGCSVVLSDGVKGIVAPQHWPSKPLVGSIHQGIVVYVNYTNNYLQISLNGHVNQRIQVEGTVGDISVGQALFARLLFINPKFVLCAITHGGNRQIGYMPICLHENLSPNNEYFLDLKSPFKFVVTLIENNKIIGIEKGLIRKLKKNAVDKRKCCESGIKTETPAKRKRVSSKKNAILNLPEQFFQIKKNGHTSYVPTIYNGVTDDVRENGNNTTSENSDEEDITDNEDTKHVPINSNKIAVDIKDENNTAFGSSDEEDITENGSNTTFDGSDAEDITDNTNNVTFENSDEDDDYIDIRNNMDQEADDDDLPLTLPQKKRVSFSNSTEICEFEVDSDRRTFVPPSVNNFFDSDEEEQKEVSSSDEEREIETVKPKKKKLSRAEQAELFRKQEEELRKKELEFADPSSVPASAEQFDRRLLAEPNSSKLWTQYISFHLSSTEIEKARVVVKRALQSVDLKAEQDRLNIWIASLNLESYYGTKESFTKVFEEAVRCNDDFTIYMLTINMLFEKSDNSSLEDYIRKARAKFKQNPKMYHEIGRIYYMQKRFLEARKLKDNALRTIINISEHIPLIVKFANMEFNYGEDYQAEALFETVLQSNPKRVDVWCTYVDQLVKKDKIDIARRVLERAVMQQLSVKKMKTLHKKFHDFENAHGDEETKREQRKILENYTKKFGNIADD